MSTKGDQHNSLVLHPLLTEHTRLQIMAALASVDDAIDFNSLREMLDLSKGNLSGHMRKLEDGSLVEVKKEFVDRKSRTTYRCTNQGRHAVEQYLESVEVMLKRIHR